MTDNLIQYKVKEKILSEKEINLEIANHLKTRAVKNACVEVEVVGKTAIKKLNLKFMKKNCPTDVLSFPLDKIPGEDQMLCKHIGTIVLCNDIIKLNAKKSGKSVREEFKFILKHGLDHLVGIHHN